MDVLGNSLKDNIKGPDNGVDVAFSIGTVTTDKSKRPGRMHHHKNKVRAVPTTSPNNANTTQGAAFTFQPPTPIFTASVATGTNSAPPFSFPPPFSSIPPMPPPADPYNPFMPYAQDNINAESASFNIGSSSMFVGRKNSRKSVAAKKTRSRNYHNLNTSESFRSTNKGAEFVFEDVSPPLATSTFTYFCPTSQAGDDASKESNSKEADFKSAASPSSSHPFAGEDMHFNIGIQPGRRKMKASKVRIQRKKSTTNYASLFSRPNERSQDVMGDSPRSDPKEMNVHDRCSKVDNSPSGVFTFKKVPTTYVNGTQAHHEEDDIANALRSLNVSSTNECRETKNAQENVNKSIANQYKDAANELYQKEDYANALIQYSKALEFYPSSSICLGNRAACYMMMNRFSDALKDCLRAIEIDPVYIKVYIRAGQAQLNMGDIKEARAHFSNAIRIANDVIRSNESESKLYALEQSKQRAMEGLELATVLKDKISLAQTAILNKKPSQAEEHIVKALEIAPHSRTVNVLKLEMLLGMKRMKAAIKFCEHLLPNAFLQPPHQNLKPGIWLGDDKGVDGKILVGYAKALLYIGDLKAAERLLSCIPKNMQDENELIRYLQKLRTMNAEKDAGNAAFKEGDYESAVRRYTAALQVDSRAEGFNAILYNNRAAAYMALGLFDKAVTDCDRSLSIDDTNEKACIRRGRSLIQLGKYQRGIADLLKIYVKDPSRVDIEDEINAAQRKLDAVKAKEQEDRARSARKKKQEKQQQREYQQHHNKAKSGRRFDHEFPRQSYSYNTYGNNNNNDKKAQAPPGSPGGSKSMKCYYSLLGVARNATDVEIKKGYHKMALKYHPDKNNATHAEETFKKIQEAYHTLSHDARRRQYDYESRSYSSRS